MSRARVIQKIKGQLRGHASIRKLSTAKRGAELKARLKRAQTPTVKPKGRLPNPLFIRSQEQIVRAYDKATAMVYQAQSYERDGKAGKARSLNAKAKALYRKADKAQERLDLRANPRRNGFFDSDAIASAKRVKRIHKVQERNTKEDGEIIGVHPGGFIKVKWDNRERPTLIKRSEIKRYPYLRNPKSRPRYPDRFSKEKRNVIFRIIQVQDKKFNLTDMEKEQQFDYLGRMGDTDLAHVLRLHLESAKSNPGIMEIAGGLQALDYLGEKVGVGKRKRGNPKRGQTIWKHTAKAVPGGAREERARLGKNYFDAGKRVAQEGNFLSSKSAFRILFTQTPWRVDKRVGFTRSDAEKAFTAGYQKENPSVSEMSERFQGRTTGETEEYYFSNSAPRLDMSRAGKLVFLKLKGATIRVPQSVVVIDPKTEKLWLGCKSQNGMFKRKAKPGEQLDYGEVDAICYLTAKKHIGGGRSYEYAHLFGENDGRRPRLFVDHEGMPILKGGDYKIEDRGIVN